MCSPELSLCRYARVCPDWNYKMLYALEVRGLVTEFLNFVSVWELQIRTKRNVCVQK